MKKFKQRRVGGALAVLLAIVCLAVAIALPVATTPALAAEADGTSPGQTASKNIWSNRYTWNWASTVKSYIEATSDGGYDRVEWTDNALHIEHYDSRFSFVSGQTIDASTYTPTGASDVYWGGYFKGSQYRFVVTGQENPNQSDDVAVVRVTKYSMDWKCLASIEYSGINVYSPFDAGSLRMTESNGELWIRTCHTMYGEVHHQANMTFRIRESDLAKLDSETSVSNYGSKFGYASHSFNQYIVAAGGKIYAADHGDAYPRMITVKDITPSSSGTSYPIIKFKGSTGDNYTGATLDGFESANDGASLIAVGTLADQDKTFANSSSDDESGSRNVWVGVVSTADGSVAVKNITSYAFDDASTATSPVLAKLSENKFLLMWSTRKKDDYYYTYGPVQYAFMDAAGNLTSSVSSFDGSLSDCHPVVVGNNVVWYSTGVSRKGEYGYTELVASAPTFYSLDITTGKVTSKKPSVPMYRLYNQWSGEHLFTLSKDEVDSLTSIGWKYEGVAWQSPIGSDSPVYRLYNPYSGDHFYTSSENEYNSLGEIGWNQEGVAFYSADSTSGKPIYRLFNRWLTQGTHLFTTSADEYQYLGSIGWSQEGTAFYSL
ncbi:MAG: hypothetical protein ACI4B6_08500 [Atopobiaceae bacterium]